MDTLARYNLEKLLNAGEKVSAGLRIQLPTLTKTKLAEYRNLTSLQKKDTFEETMKAARVEGAIELFWDNERENSGFIYRINLLDAKKLASFLDKALVQDKVMEARQHLQQHLEKYPVLNDVLGRWMLMRKCRKLGPESYQDWIDSICTIENCAFNKEQPISLPVREFSARLFKDSKRVEKLIGPLDILLSGSTDAEVRQIGSVLQELGLFREEQPILMAGNVLIRRDRVTAYLDRPYIGLPAASLKGLESIPTRVITIENLTTFHSEARKLCDEPVLLVYTAGMPSPGWRAMYVRILKSLSLSTSLYHWGDVDEGGFRIASILAQDAKEMGHILKPWKMHPDDVPEDLRCEASKHTLARIRYFAEKSGWAGLGKAIAEAGFTVEQESLS